MRTKPAPSGPCDFIFTFNSGKMRCHVVGGRGLPCGALRPIPAAPCRALIRHLPVEPNQQLDQSTTSPATPGVLSGVAVCSSDACSLKEAPPRRARPLLHMLARCCRIPAHAGAFRATLSIGASLRPSVRVMPCSERVWCAVPYHMWQSGSGRAAVACTVCAVALRSVCSSSRRMGLSAGSTRT